MDGDPDTPPRTSEVGEVGDRLRTVFVSYSRADAGYVKSLVELLEAIGCEVRYDHTAIRQSEGFPTELARAINESDAIVAVLSAKSVQSEWVERELAYAQGKGKQILFVERSPNVALNDAFRLQFGSVQRLAMPDPRHSRSRAALAAALDGEAAAPVPRRWWPYALATLAVVVLATASWLMLRPATWSMQNFEFVVDMSGSASDTIEGESGQITKRSAIETALEEKIDRKLSASMALRTFGTGPANDCDGSELEVPFQRDNGATIIETVTGNSGGGGPANLFQAVDLALQDLQVPIEDLPSALATRKIIVFLTADTVCDGAGEALAVQIEELATDGIDIELRVVGLDLADDSGREIQATFHDICDVNCAVRFTNVATTADLEDEMTQLVQIEPLIDLTEAIRELNAESLEHANEAVDAANGGDTETFDRSIEEAEQAVREASAVFDDTIGRISFENEDGRYDDLADTARDAQAALADWVGVLGTLGDLVEVRSDENADEESIERWNDAVGEANDASSELGRLNRAFNDGIEELIADLQA